MTWKQFSYTDIMNIQMFVGFDGDKKAVVNARAAEVMQSKYHQKFCTEVRSCKDFDTVERACRYGKA